ncbi:MAG: DUF1801 domain-containing protein [Acidobacteria bacterium]|nr:DUF1801 domain-containing protein [Acidobacteriota bacterium]
MKSSAATVDEYLGELPDDRREAMNSVRATILDNLPTGYVESMGSGMIVYEIPLETVPDTYNGRPLMYAALASQKNHMSVYLMGIYADEPTNATFLKAYKAFGKRLDMGKSCVRFRKLADLPLGVIGDAIAAHTVVQFTELYRRSRP